MKNVCCDKVEQKSSRGEREVMKLNTEQSVKLFNTYSSAAHFTEE